MPLSPAELQKLVKRTLLQPIEKTTERELERLVHEIEEFQKARGEIPPETWEFLEDVLHEPRFSTSHSQFSRHLQYILNRSRDNRRLSKFPNQEDPSKIPNVNLSKDDDVVFMLGAGASAASDIPLVTGLLDNLVDQAKRTQDEGFNRLMMHCQSEEDLDIEDLLTAVYLSEFAVAESNTLDLLHYFLFSGDNSFSPSSEPFGQTSDTDAASVNFIQDAIQTLFGSIASEMIPKDPNKTHTQIRRFIEEHENVSIITTNYDYCMDEELFGEVNVDTILNQNETGDNESADHDVSVELYKMHGSINWSYCDSCQNIDGVRPDVVKEKFTSESGTLDYPVIGICPVCKGQSRPMLVPPTSFKFVQFPPLIDIRSGAKKRLEEADYIIPVGYSFSDADAYIYKLVWGAMRRHDETKMLVVDPNAKNGVATELQTRFKGQVDGFDEDRVVPVHGPSEEMMDGLVDEMLDY